MLPSQIKLKSNKQTKNRMLEVVTREKKKPEIRLKFNSSHVIQCLKSDVVKIRCLQCIYFFLHPSIQHNQCCDAFFSTFIYTFLYYMINRSLSILNVFECTILINKFCVFFCCWKMRQLYKLSFVVFYHITINY